MNDAVAQRRESARNDTNGHFGHQDRTQPDLFGGALDVPAQRVLATEAVIGGRITVTAGEDDDFEVTVVAGGGHRGTILGQCADGSLVEVGVQPRGDYDANVVTTSSDQLAALDAMFARLGVAGTVSARDPITSAHGATPRRSQMVVHVATCAALVGANTVVVERIPVTSVMAAFRARTEARGKPDREPRVCQCVHALA